MRGSMLAPVCFALLISGVQAEVPLSKDSTGHLTVPAFVNNKGPFQFILDTGADESAVFSWFAKSLHLAKGESRDLSGATGSVQMTGSRLSTLAIDGHIIRDVDADTVPNRTDGARIAGVAGVDMMVNRPAIIDFGCATFALRPIQNARPEIVGKNATLTNAGSIKDGKQLTLPVNLNGIVGVAVLDSGARGTMINYKFAAAAGIHPESSSFRDGEPARGATTTPVLSRVGPIGNIRFGGITRNDVIARVVDLPYLESAGLSGGPAMNLGLDLLVGTRLTVDYSSRRFWLAESSCKLTSQKVAH